VLLVPVGSRGTADAAEGSGSFDATHDEGESFGFAVARSR
jgi:hypothetical protein